MAKFRSWNKVLNKFLYFYNGLYFKTLEDLKEYNNTGKIKIKCTYDVFFDWKNAEIFTGLFDKEGRPLFENDYVEHIGCNGVPDGISQIVWDDEASAFYTQNDRLDIYDYFENVSYNCSLFGNEHEDWSIICEELYG